MNREASMEAMERGLEYKSSGDLKNALRMFEKSIRLHQSASAERLAAETRAQMAQSASSAGTSSPSSGAAAGHASSNGSSQQPSSSKTKSKSRNSSPTRPRSTANSGSTSSPAADVGSSSNTSTSSSTGSSAGPSDEVVLRIVKAECHYHVLGLRREGERGNSHFVAFSESALKKQYRRLALQVHPDKCKHPRAEEAFKKVGSAYQTLSDSQKRAVYDRYGEEGVQRQQSRAGRGGGGGGAEFFAEDLTPEELFEMFFFGRRPGGAGGARGGRSFHSAGGPTFTFSTFGDGAGIFQQAARRGQRRPAAGAAQHSSSSGLRALCTLFGPMIFLTLFSLLTSLLSGGAMADYSLSRTTAFPAERFTQPTQTYPELKFFVAPDFDKSYSVRQRRQIDSMVRQDYVDVCNREAQRVRSYMYYSFFTGSYSHTPRSQKIPTPHCDALGVKIK